MNTRTIIHICLAGLFVLAVLYVMGKWSSPEWQENPFMPFISIVTLAIGGGIFFVLVILPRMGDAVGTMMYSSGEEVKQDDSMKAAARMAAGDYQGAVGFYRKMMEANPDDTYPISEIAKITAEKLHDQATALQFLQEHLERKEWAEDDAAFIMFRISDIHSKMGAFDEARNVLEQVAGNFPGTRHSANARHKIGELEQAQYKEMQAARARQAANES